jgi:hypothetical protein
MLPRNSHLSSDLESPFMEDVLAEVQVESEPGLERLEVESPFLEAFAQGGATQVDAAEAETAWVEEEAPSPDDEDTREAFDFDREECEGAPDEWEEESALDSRPLEEAFDVEEEAQDLVPANRVDEEVAQPAFAQTVRDSIGPLLAAKRVREALQWNSTRHPGKSGINANQLRTRLDRYLNSAAIEKVMRNSSELKNLSTDPGAVLAVLAHQFQQKIYASTGEQDGKIGDGTLDALGFVHHQDNSLNVADVLNHKFHVTGKSKAFQQLTKVYNANKSAFQKTGRNVSPQTWYRMFVNAPFLGRRFKNGIHLELMKRLRQAEKWLLSQLPYQKLSPVQLGAALGIDEDHAGGRTKNNSSMHTLGLAVDIGYIKNPWVAGQSGADTRNSNFRNVTKNVSRLLKGTEQEEVTPRWLASLAAPGGSTDTAYRSIQMRHKNLQTYLSLERDLPRLRAVILQHRNSRQVIGQTETTEAAVIRWQATIKSDRARLQYAIGSNRKPEAGFLNLHRDLVVALRDHGCLAWGAIDLGARESGDIKHFDCRATGIGWELALEKQRTVGPGHPCVAKPAVESEISRSTAKTAIPIDHLGGRLFEFVAHSVSLRVAVFCPKAVQSSDVEVLIYVHGLLNPCPPAPKRPADLITEKPFKLGSIVDASNRAVILVVPFVVWKRHQPHPLSDPGKLNRFVEELLEEVGRTRGASAPSLRALILAGHSRAYGFLDPLAKARAQPEMRRGALSKLTQLWAFDTAYTSPIADYEAWLRSNPNLVFHVFYREGSDKRPPLTRFHGRRFRTLVKGNAGRFNVTAVAEDHCSVPIKQLPSLLAVPDPVPEVQYHEEPESAEEGEDEESPSAYEEEQDHSEHGMAWEDEALIAEEAWTEGEDEHTYAFDEIPSREEETQDSDEVEDQTHDSLEVGELDSSVLDIAERTIAREAPEFEEQVASRWTGCFSAADVARVEQVYQDNEGAASANGIDRCSCIVMLNVALGQLLSLPLKSNRARSKSTRTVQMGSLTTKSIEKAMQQLRNKGYAQAPTVMNFYDRRNKTAGTLKPVKLKASVQAKVLALAKTKGCWFAYGLSIMDGYHSVLLLVDRTGTAAKIYWLDQFSAGLTDDVTTSLDQRVTDKTLGWWQAVMDEKGKGYNTTIRIWPLKRKR